MRAGGDDGRSGGDAELKGLKHSPKIVVRTGLYQLHGEKHGPTGGLGDCEAGPCPKGPQGWVTHDKPAAGTENSLDVCQANRAAPLSVNFT